MEEISKHEKGFLEPKTCTTCNIRDGLAFFEGKCWNCLHRTEEKTLTIELIKLAITSGNYEIYYDLLHRLKQLGVITTPGDSDCEANKK